MSVLTNIGAGALAITTASAAIVAGMSVGDIALAELGLQQPDLQLNDLLADLGFDKSVAWWFFINPDEDSPVRILFLYYREF